MGETVKGLNIKIGLDTSDLDQKLKGVNTQLKEGQKDLKAINNSLKFDSNNLDKWKEKQDKLNSLIDQTKQRLELQNKRLEEAKKALELGAISEEQFNRLQRSVQYTETDINKLNKELLETENQIKKLGGVNIEGLKRLGSNFTKYLTLPIVAAASALAALTVKSMQNANQMATNASRVNLSVEAYQELNHVARILNVETNSLQRAFMRTNSILGDLTQGGAKYNQTLERLGLSSDQLAGKSTEDAFLIIRDALSGVEDQAERTAIANQIFGERLGTELSEILRSSSEDIKDLREEARNLGITTTEQAQKASEFSNALTRLRQSVSNLTVTIGVQVVPILQIVVDTLTERVVPAIRQVVDWWGNLSNSLRRVIIIMLGVLAAIGPLIKIMLQFAPIIKTLKAVMAGGWLLKFFQGFSVGKLAIAGIVGVLAYLLIKSESFRELIKKIIDALVGLLSPLGDLIAMLMAQLKPVIDSIIQVVETLVSVFGEIIEVILELLNDLVPILVMVLTEVIKIFEALMPVIEIVISLIGQIIIELMILIKAILPPIIQILNIMIQVVGKIIGVIGNLLSAILEPLNSILGALVVIIEVVVTVLGVLINVLIAALEPVLKIIFAVLEPILLILMVFIDLIAMLMNLLTPLINTLLRPLTVVLNAIVQVFSTLAPLVQMVGDIFGDILAPALEVVFNILEPIMWVLEKIIDAFKWIIDNVSKVADFFGNVFKNIGNFFGNLFGGSDDPNQNYRENRTTNNVTTNNVTVNTTSPTFDVNSINKALGGNF